MTLLPISCFRVLCAASLAFSFVGRGASAATNTKAPIPAATRASKDREALPVEATKSVFKAVQGRNPFFPTSPIQVTDQEAGRRNVLPPDPVEQLQLKGIIPKGNKPTALINDQTFEEGETGEVRVRNGTKLLITCEEIRAESVIISKNDVKHELKLRPDF